MILITNIDYVEFGHSLTVDGDKVTERKVEDEVIVHELLHLRYPNHGKMFHILVKHHLENNKGFIKSKNGVCK